MITFLRQAFLLLATQLFFLANIYAAPDVYVDAAVDFTPVNPAIGQTVTWNGSAGAVGGLVFGTDAFSTVQEGIDAADTGGTVHIAAGEYFEGREISVGKTLTLQGDGADLTALLRDDSDGAASLNKHSVVRVFGGDTVATLDSLRISGGREDESGGGGGIESDSSVVIVNFCIVSGNTAELGESGGGIGTDRGRITVNNSTVSGNTTEGVLRGAGGIYGRDATITVNNSTVIGNTAVDGFSIGGGLAGLETSIRLNNSTVSGNSAKGPESGGAIGGFFHPVIVNNSTVSGNTAVGSKAGGGIGGFNLLVTVNNSTISGNVAEGDSTGGGIGGDGIQDIIISNSLIVGNSAQNVQNAEVLSSLFLRDNGGNLLLIPDGLVLGDILAPLSDNGGGTLTHALVAGSPAIDAGDNNLLAADLEFDQRGAGFSRVSKGNVDAGAFEVQNTPPVITLAGGDFTVALGNAIECATGNFTDPGATASDAEDGEITGNIVVSGTVDVSIPGIYTLNYDVSDSFGVSAPQVVRTIEVVDTTPPLIRLNGNASLTIPASSTYIDAGAVVSDACDSSVPLITTNPVDTSIPGDYTVLYNATDASGNAAVQVTRNITVAEPSRYSVAAQVASIAEGNGTNSALAFTVSRTGDDFPGEVDWSVDLVNGLTTADILISGGNVTFAAGENSQVIVLEVVGDRLTESDEILTVRIANPDPSSGIIVTATAQTTILNDDSDPVAAPDGPFIAIAENTLTVPDSAGVLANDTDVDADQTLSAAVVTTTSNGQLTLNAEGGFIYIPDADFSGTDTFTYSASDGTNTAEATATISVTEQVNIVVNVVSLPNVIVAGGPPVAAFRVDVVNLGPSDATGISIAQNTIFPAGVSVSSASPNAGVFANGTWTLDLADDESASLTVFVQTTGSAQPGVFQYGVSVVGVNQAEIVTTDNSDSDTNTILNGSELELDVVITPVLDNQTGLFTSSLRITNNGSGTAAAFRVFVTNLPADVSLFNASGTDAVGRPFLLFNQNLVAGDSIDLIAEYFRPSLDPDFTPSFEVEVLAAPEGEPVAADSGIEVTRMIILSNGDVLIEITSQPGATYAIEYSPDMSPSSWIRVRSTVTAAANRLQWIDNGPPKTDSHPSEAASRFYRFALIAAPTNP